MLSIARICFIFCCLSSLALTINVSFYRYPGNNYFPPNTPEISCLLILIYIGACLHSGKSSRLAYTIREIIIFFLIMCVLAIATNAAQYTPFNPIDSHILAWQTHIPFTTEDLLIWNHAHPFIKMCMEVIYDSLTYQMTYLPLFVIMMGHFKRIKEYYFLLLVTGIIGYSIYYFFPTTAPASVIDSAYFNDMQRATGLKFSQIHQYIPPTTLEGGLIAFPSLHVIWAYLCVILVRDWPVLYRILFIINLILAASCVILGWHYVLDVAGSVLVILIGQALYRVWEKQHLSAAM